MHQNGVNSVSGLKTAIANSMPEHIRAEPDIGVFRKLLKIHIFLA